MIKVTDSSERYRLESKDWAALRHLNLARAPNDRRSWCEQQRSVLGGEDEKQRYRFESKDWAALRHLKLARAPNGRRSWCEPQRSVLGGEDEKQETKPNAIWPLLRRNLNG